jgi:FAD/FMN-containing dehydrogenase
MSKKNSFSRRGFVKGTAAAAGGLLLGRSGLAETPRGEPMNIEALKKACKGVVATQGDANFTELIHGDLWNRLIPRRAPQIVMRVKDEQDVIAAIRFARENKLKVVVRGGGHNWCQPTLRNGGLLIDLVELNKVISIDVGARKAVVQPIISNRDIQKTLNAKGLAYPTGHCPQVKLSGYLLGGGMSWNQGVWGSGAESVEAIELVTAEGKLITASKNENAEYFWAARGSGSGFFGVVTRYHLKLYPLPKAIHGSTYYYSMDDAAAVAGWLGENAAKISPAVELSLFLLEAPANLKEKTAAQGSKLAMVTATAFSDSPEEAKTMLKPLEDCPFVHKCLSRSFATPLVFEKMFDLSGALWPEGLRNHVEATFSNTSPRELVKAVAVHMTKCPSPITVILFVIFTGPNVPAAHPDAAYSMSSRVYGGPWTMWKEAADDATNTQWHNECTALLRPFNIGYYVGESDTVRRPSNAVESMLPENWKRLADLRDKYDPDGVFFGYFDGLSEPKPS